MDTLIHSLRDITIRRISVSEMDNNVYLLTAKESGAQLLIDAADDLPAIQRLLADAAADTSGEPNLALIATTHQHWDHLSGFLQARDVFEQIGVRELWLAWTEDPADKVADDLRTTPDPSAEELRLIREELDPDGVYVKR